MPEIHFHGKAAVQKYNPPFHLLQQEDKLSVKGKGWEDNLIIEGDNLLALKALMPKYAGRVKCIYIDPPYNTNNKDWVYSDRVNDPLIEKWFKEHKEVDYNDQSRHAKWCCMMLPRLKLLHQLLKNDGVIFISIDDNEVAHLKMLMDEIFGETSFVELFSWYKTLSPSNLSNKSKKCLEYILCYEKKKNNSRYKGLAKDNPADNPLIKKENTIKELTFPKDKIICTLKKDHFFKKGEYGTKVNKVVLKNNVWFRNGVFENDLVLESRFIWTQDNLKDELIKKTKIIFKGSKSLAPRYDKIEYLPEVPSNLIDVNDEVGTTEEGGAELAKILGTQKVFDYPKPPSLIKYLLNFVVDDDDIILDSFAGSGTTAQAVLDLNFNKGGNRKFILVQMPEKSSKCENICRSITRERVKRVINGYKTPKGLEVEGLGSGFSYYTIGEKLFVHEGEEIHSNVSWQQLAPYIYFTETGESLKEEKKMNQPFIGSHQGTDYFLIYKKPQVNILNDDFLTLIKKSKTKHKVIIYADVCRVDEDILEKYNIVFRQIPYDILSY